MAHNVKCLICGKIFDRDKEEWVKPKSNRYAHKKCVDKPENQDTIQNLSDEETFYQTVKSIYGKGYNYQLINQQALNYIKQYNYTWSGMTGCLHWFYEIKKNSVEDSNGGIGIIPYIYDEVKKYYQIFYQAQEKNKSKKVQTPEYNITIQSPTFRGRPPHLLDIE